MSRRTGLRARAPPPSIITASVALDDGEVSSSSAAAAASDGEVSSAYAPSASGGTTSWSDAPATPLVTSGSDVDHDAPNSSSRGGVPAVGGRGGKRARAGRRESGGGGGGSRGCGGGRGSSAGGVGDGGGIPPLGDGQFRGLPPYSPATASVVRGAFLAHYRTHGRQLPWRAPPRPVGVPRPASPPPAPAAGSAYTAWTAEVVLGQVHKRVDGPSGAAAAVAAWLAAYPTVAALGAAPVAAARRKWGALGLGNFRPRGERMHRAAVGLVADAAAAARGGGDSGAPDLPRTVADLRRLPGVGVTTAAAIAASAYGIPAPVVDGVTARVWARLRPPAVDVEELAARPPRRLTVAAASAAATRHATPHAAALVAGCDGAAADDPGDLAAAVWEVGATVCTTSAPACGACPVRTWCGAAAEAVAAGVDPPSYVVRWPRQAARSATRRARRARKHRKA